MGSSASLRRVANGWVVTVVGDNGEDWKPPVEFIAVTWDQVVSELRRIFQRDATTALEAGLDPGGADY